MRWGEKGRFKRNETELNNWIRKLCFGNPLWLRLALAVPMAVYPLVSLGIYAVLGTAVLASRMIAPETQRTEPLKATEPQPVSVLQNNAEPPFELPLAA